MYGAIWRVLPGPGFLKFLQMLLLTAGVIALLWFVVFPWAEPLLPFGDVTVDGADTTGP